MTAHTTTSPSLKIRDFEGPLDLLFHLIEKNDMDIYDIPIAEITEQYLTYIRTMETPDMEDATSFLVMASTLIHIKSRMLLPGKTLLDATAEEDPREELVMRLLQYRRCKIIAGELKERFGRYSPVHVRLPMTPKSMGISLKPPVQTFNQSAFHDALASVTNRNQLRFADISAKISHILKRDKMSVKEKMKWIWSKLKACKTIFFHEVFSAKNSTKMEKITGFLAILELLRGDRITVEQEYTYGAILLKKKDGTEEDLDKDLLSEVLGESENG